jgi:ElaB/YqjD/DUF883 family membrane-anchored ribosome-binding protein
MNKDSAEGVGRQMFGEGEELAGRLLKDTKTAGQGIYDDATVKAQTVYDNVKEVLATGVGAATADLAGLRNDIAKLTQTVNKLVQSGALSAQSHVVDAVGAAGDKISQSASMAQEKLVSIEADVESRIKKSPWTAIAIAVTLGVLIGKLS